MVDKYNPLVSIIIPVYNGADYLKQAIDSALSQTYENLEILVINDGSSDGGITEDIAKSYGDKVKYFYKENGGVATALNFGIKKMQGEYFSWLSHDDIYKSDKIEKQIALLNKYKEKYICLCEIEVIDRNSKKINRKFQKRKLLNRRLNDWNLALKDLLKSNSFYGCAFLIPKNIFEECGYFEENLRFCQDYLMWLKIFLNKHPLVYLDERLVSMRLHSNQLTQTGRALYHTESIKLSKKIIPQLKKVSTKKENFLYYYAVYNARYENTKVVKWCIKVGKNMFSCLDIFKIRIMENYGHIRTILRKLYYRVVLNIRTT